MFAKELADTGRPVELACGRCMECRVSRRREWTLRLMHESQLYERNCFVTLTYDNEHNPDTLVKRHVQLWLMRLRERIYPAKVRYFLVGEYGSQLARPHYHALLFGYDYPDKRYWKGDGLNRLFTSEMQSALWPFGHSLIGGVSSASAAYVCGYVCKKITGEKADEYYNGRLPEFALMSRKPGLGAGWIDKYAKTGVFSRDFVITGVQGSPVAVPKYYTLRQPDCIEMREVKAKRRLAKLERKLKCPEEFGAARLLAKQTCIVAKVTREASERELEV